MLAEGLHFWFETVQRDGRQSGVRTILRLTWLYCVTE